MRKVAIDGNISSSLVEDLIKAKRVVELKSRIDQNSNNLSTIFGETFYEGYDTNFDYLQLKYEAALTLTKSSEILLVEREKIAEVSTNSKTREIEQLALFTQSSLEAWTKKP